MPVSFLLSSGNHLADGLGGAGGGRDDVFQDAAATAPVLVGRTVDGLLRGGGGVHGRHQAALDAPGVVQYLGDRRQAVGGARSVGDDGFSRVGLVVHTIDEHRRVVLGRRRHDDLLGAGGDVLLAGLLGEKKAGGLDHDVGAHFVPLQFSGILDGSQADSACR